MSILNESPIFLIMPSCCLGIDNSFVVVWMVLISLVGRVGFRRYGDALDDDIPERKIDEMEAASGDVTALKKLNESPSSDGTKTDQKPSESSQ